MGRLITILCFLIISNITLAQIIDIDAIKKEVTGLVDIQSKKRFLKAINTSDQKYRGTQTVDSIDFWNLVAISEYANVYGHPNPNLREGIPAIPHMVWVHNKYSRLDRHCFPIILKGMLAGDKNHSQDDIRKYYLKNLYQAKFDDERYKTLPLKELFEICEVNMSDHISIDTILMIKAEEDRIYNIETISESTWESAKYTNSLPYEGKDIHFDLGGERIRFVEKMNGVMYLIPVYNENIGLKNNGAGYLKELEKVGDNKFKLKGKVTDKYYEVLDSTVLYRDTSKVYKKYDGVE